MYYLEYNLLFITQELKVTLDFFDLLSQGSKLWKVFINGAKNTFG